MKYIEFLWKWIPALIQLFSKNKKLKKIINQMSKDVFDKKN